MSLDNVFMGKKVVQQIYLKNALIYQSKGWETLPSAPQVEWTKNFGTTEYTPYDCSVDKENNIYIVFFNCIYKISSEGDLVWKKIISSPRMISMCIDHDNNIYVAIPDSTPKVQKLDKNGNVLATIAISQLLDAFTGITVDNNNLYLSGTYNNHYNDYLYVLDKSLSTIQYRNTKADGLITSDNSPYLYYTDGKYLKSIEKNSFSSSSNSESPVINKNLPYDSSISNANIIRSIIDNLGNIIYLTSGFGLFKCNINTKDTTKVASISNVTENFCLDYQQNIYCLDFSNSGSGPYPANLIKTSSDGTLIYNTQIVKANYVYAFNSSALVADNNGNIYLIYKDDKELLITKIINLVKKGN